MKSLLFSLPFLLLISCDGGRPPIDVPEGFPGEPVTSTDPYTPDSICLFSRERTGSILGEWVEVGDLHAIISETECFSIDTTDFATRYKGNWVFKNDSVIEINSKDVEIKNDSTHLLLNGDYTFTRSYQARGVNDTLIVLDKEHMWCDTFRITRLDADTMILARAMYGNTLSPPDLRSWLYYRRR